MSEYELLSIVAAIVHAGADDSEGSAGYSPESAVKIGARILAAAKTQIAQNSNDELTRQMDAGETKEPEK